MRDRWHNNAVDDDQSGSGHPPDSAVYVRREWAFGYFLACCIDAIAVARSNAILINWLLECRNIRTDRSLLSGFVILTGLDEQPFPGTWKRFRDMKPGEGRDGEKS